MRKLLAMILEWLITIFITISSAFIWMLLVIPITIRGLLLGWTFSEVLDLHTDTFSRFMANIH